MNWHEEREKFLNQPYSEELADKIQNMASELCIWYDHKGVFECPDCPEFGTCNIYEYCEKICEAEDIRNSAKKEAIKELLETTIFPIIDEGYTNKETIKAVIRKTVAAHYDIEELSNKNDRTRKERKDD